MRAFFRSQIGQALVLGGALLILGGLALAAGGWARAVLLPPTTATATPLASPAIIAPTPTAQTPIAQTPIAQTPIAPPLATVTLVPSPTATPPPAFESYTVRPGDTLYAIARRHQTTPERIRAANGLVADTIWPGQVLLIPRD